MITCNSCIWKNRKITENSLPFLESHFPEYFTAGDPWLSFWIIWFYDVNVLSRPSSSSWSNMICRWYSCSPGQAMISDIACLFIMPLLQECQESPQSYFSLLNNIELNTALRWKWCCRSSLQDKLVFMIKLPSDSTLPIWALSDVWRISLTRCSCLFLCLPGYFLPNTAKESMKPHTVVD